MNLLLPYFQLLRAVVPHVVALPALVVFRRGWGVHHASFPRFVMGWIMNIPLTLASALVLGPERADAALARHPAGARAPAGGEAAADFRTHAAGDHG